MQLFDISEQRVVLSWLEFNVGVVQEYKVVVVNQLSKTKLRAIYKYP